MKHTLHWYHLLALCCFFTILTIIYRREARLRAYMHNMEARLSVLESYNQGLITRNETLGGTPTEENNSTPDAPINNRITHASQRSLSAPGNIGNPPQPMAQTAGETTTQTSRATTNPLSEPTTTESQSTSTDLADLQAMYSEGKFKQKIRIELNTADSATLVRVPGIGARTALTILNYRDKLGGFYSAEQLREKLVWDYALSYLDEWCRDWFWADEQFVQKLNINKLSFKELARHPYIGYENTKTIFYWRKQHGDIHSRTELEQMGIFTPEKLDQLMHYISF